MGIDDPKRKPFPFFMMEALESLRRHVPKSLYTSIRNMDRNQ